MFVITIILFTIVVQQEQPSVIFKDIAQLNITQLTKFNNNVNKGYNIYSKVV